jgi:hypothetical protein
MDFHEEARSEELCGPGERARRGQPSMTEKSSVSILETEKTLALL